MNDEKTTVAPGGGLRHDGGKAPMALVPFDAVEEVAHVLGYGSKKYTRRLSVTNGDAAVELLQRLLCEKTTRLPSAILIGDMPLAECASSVTLQRILRPDEQAVTLNDLRSIVDSAALAMSARSKKNSPTMPSDNVSTLTSGDCLMGNDSKRQSANTHPEGASERETPLGTTSKGSRGLTSPLNEQSKYSNVRTGVQYATPRPTLNADMISTTTTEPESSADSSVTDATRDSAFWAITRSLLGQLSGTSKPAIEGSELIIPGAGNWARGMFFSSTFGCLLRHVTRRLMGETHDPETGRLHTAHIACNALFLTAFELRGTGTDDLEIWRGITSDPQHPTTTQA
jgi:hypothetical protein